MDWNETAAELARAWAEQPVIMPGAYGELYGIFTPPAPEVSPAGLCVVLFSRNRWWHDRLTVKSARWLAARGFACLRFDYHGVGESEGTCCIHGDRPFRDDAVAVIRYMRKEFAQQRFILSGFCFDGRTALSAIEEEADAIEAVVCTSPSVMAFAGEPLTYILSIEKLRTFLSSPLSFKKLMIVRALRHCRNLIKLAKTRRPGEGLVESQISVNFKQEFHALIRSRARCLFLQGQDDTQYHEFELVERYLLAKLEPEQRARITVEAWPGNIHSLDNPQVVRKVIERTVCWIDECRRAPFTSAEPVPSLIVPEMANGQAPITDQRDLYLPAFIGPHGMLPAKD